jgi:hypothetical protein
MHLGVVDAKQSYGSSDLAISVLMNLCMLLFGAVISTGRLKWSLSVMKPI